MTDDPTPPTPRVLGDDPLERLRRLRCLTATEIAVASYAERTTTKWVPATEVYAVLEDVEAARRHDAQQLEDLRGQLLAATNHPTPTLEYRCFHCGEVFRTPGGAQDHFGKTPGAIAGCLIDHVALEEGGKAERGRGLQMALRKAEAERDALRVEKDRAMAVLVPHMPESGLEDAARQVKQAAISAIDNCETLEAALATVTAERDEAKAIADEEAKRARDYEQAANKAEAQHAALLGLIRDLFQLIGWEGIDEHVRSCCPLCLKYQAEGHEPTCSVARLAALLASQEGPQ